MKKGQPRLKVRRLQIRFQASRGLPGGAGTRSKRDLTSMLIYVFRSHTISAPSPRRGHDESRRCNTYDGERAFQFPSEAFRGRGSPRTEIPPGVSRVSWKPVRDDVRAIVPGTLILLETGTKVPQVKFKLPSSLTDADTPCRLRPRGYGLYLEEEIFRFPANPHCKVRRLICLGCFCLFCNVRCWEACISGAPSYGA